MIEVQENDAADQYEEETVSDYTGSSNSDIRTEDLPVCTKLLRKTFPTGFMKEFKVLMSLLVPVSFTSLITFLFGPISALFCGRYDKNALAIVGLSLSVFNMTGMAVVTGLLTACDTLFAQIFGAKIEENMVIQLQKTLIIITLMCLPCWSLHLMIEPILLVLRQNPIISKNVSDYLFYLMPGLLFTAYGQTLQKFVQTQNNVKIPVIIGGISNAVNAFFHWFFLFYFDIGIRGSAIAQTLGYLCQPIGYLIYMICSQSFGGSWRIYRKEMWYNWSEWYKLAIPGFFMLGLEWWIFEVGTVVAGALDKQQLAAQTIAFQLEMISFSFLPVGISVAASIRIGQLLGAKSHEHAVGARNVAYIVSASLATINVCIFEFANDKLPLLFTDNEETVKLASKVLPIMGSFQVLDALIGVGTGIVKGCGMQHRGAVVCFVALYCAGLPVATVSVLVWDMGIVGIWMGIAVGSAVQAFTYLIVAMRINWPEQVLITEKRIKLGLSTSNRNALADKTEDDLESLINVEESRTSQRVILKRIMMIAVLVCIFFVCIYLHFSGVWKKLLGKSYSNNLIDIP